MVLVLLKTVSRFSKIEIEWRVSTGEYSCQKMFILSRSLQMDEKLDRNPLQLPNDCLVALVCASASAWEIDALENKQM